MTKIAGVDEVGAIRLLLLSHRIRVIQDELLIFEIQEWLHEMKCAPFRPTVGNRKVGATCAKDSLCLL